MHSNFFTEYYFDNLVALLTFIVVAVVLTYWCYV